jgi:hypothetical protein
VVLVDEKSCGGSGRSMLEVTWSASFMLENIISEVKAMDLTRKKEVGEELLTRVKIYNYVPKSAEEKYRIMLQEEYRNYRGG